ncbi:MAG: cyclase family protein [Methanolinea sp.]|nr:cyclase family protein [Methanolinea sp.]
MAWYDVTRPLREGIAIYPGDIEPSFHPQDRGSYVLTAMRLSTHSGTHVDAPSHYIRGAPGVDGIDPGALIGECRVVSVGGSGSLIEARDLGGATGERLLLRTWYSGEEGFREDYPGLSPACARALADAGARCIGIDSPSIEPYSGDGTVHRALLSRGVAVIEFLDLSSVRPGEYWMAALPLRLPGLDGSPCRVILRDAWEAG